MLWEAVPSALAASFAPWTLLIVAGLLSRPRPLLHALVFGATTAVVSVGVGIVVVVVLSGTGIHDRDKHPTAGPGLQIALGLAILAFAMLVWRRPPPKAKTPRRETGLLADIVLGLVAGSPSPLYLASLNSIAKDEPDVATAVVSVILIAAIVQLMAEVPIVLFIVVPDRSTAILDRANEWLARNGRAVILTAAGIIGCYSVTLGVVQLLQ